MRAMPPNLKDEVIAARKKISEQVKQLRDTSKQLFTQSLTGLFDQHPEIEQISWTQYTPYFNDGDACTFRCGSDDAQVLVAAGTLGFPDGGEDDDYDLDGEHVRQLSEYATNKENDPFAKQKLSIVKDVHQTLGFFEDTDFLAIFGDHTRVVVKRVNGVVTATRDDYDHD